MIILLCCNVSVRGTQYMGTEIATDSSRLVGYYVGVFNQKRKPTVGPQGFIRDSERRSVTDEPDNRSTGHYGKFVVMLWAPTDAVKYGYQQWHDSMVPDGSTEYFKCMIRSTTEMWLNYNSKKKKLLSIYYNNNYVVYTFFFAIFVKHMIPVRLCSNIIVNKLATNNRNVKLYYCTLLPMRQ